MEEHLSIQLLCLLAVFILVGNLILTNQKTLNNMTENIIQSIAIIGGTGKLGVPVVQLLAENGFKIRAIVRDIDKAKRLLTQNIEIVLGDLNNPQTIEDGLKNMDAVYINLSTETTRLDLPFYEEREGVETIVKAAKKNNLQHIFKIGALGAYPKATHITVEMPVPNKIRIEGQKFIEQSGINYTIFDPTMFMDNIPNQIKGNTIEWVGNAPTIFYWIAADDYAKQVLKAINNPKAINKHYAIQGQMGMTPQEVFKLFIENYDTLLKVKSFPLWIVKAIGLFSPKMKFLGHMFSYFDQTPDPFYAEETWEELGKPTIMIQEFALQLKTDKKKLLN
jgi:uncharacterized protein YbjT (DUF2867 family)